MATRGRGRETPQFALAASLQASMRSQFSSTVVVAAAVARPVARQNAFPCFACKKKANSCPRLISTCIAFKHWKKSHSLKPGSY